MLRAPRRPVCRQKYLLSPLLGDKPACGPVPWPQHRQNCRQVPRHLHRQISRQVSRPRTLLTWQLAFQTGPDTAIKSAGFWAFASYRISKQFNHFLGLKIVQYFAKCLCLLLLLCLSACRPLPRRPPHEVYPQLSQPPLCQRLSRMVSQPVQRRVCHLVPQIWLLLPSQSTLLQVSRPPHSTMFREVSRPAHLLECQADYHPVHRHSHHQL